MSTTTPRAGLMRRPRRPSATRIPRLRLPALGPVVAPLRIGLDRANQWVSPAGWVALAAALGCLPVGALQGWTELRVLGLTALLLLAVALIWVLGRTSYEVGFDLHRRRVVAGETASGRLLITNRARRALFQTRIEMVVGKGRAHFSLPVMGRDEDHEELFDIPTRRRGVITVGPVSSVRADPMALLRRTQTWAESVDLYVHPVTVPLVDDSTGFIRDIEGVTTQDLSSNDVSFHALREYQPGDDRRAIHWRTTARVGRLMVRQFEETRRAHLLIVLPTHPDDYASETDFESAVSIAGSLARHAFSLDREVSVYTSTGLLATRTAPLLLDRLAELGPAATQVTLRDVARRAAAAVPQASVAVLVAGGTVDPRDLKAAHKALPVSVTAFALRCANTLTLAQRRLGDLTVVDLPDVFALPRAVRSIQ